MLLSRVVSIVSGGSSGLGAAAARSIINNGGKVIVADLPHQRDAFQQNVINKVAGNDDSTSHVALFAEVDVTNTEQITNALDMGESTFGTPVNAAISCAGICPARKTLSSNKKNDDHTLRMHSLEEFTKAITVNTIGTFNLARLASERMAKKNDQNDNDDGLRGCIINTASIAAYDGQIGQVAYATSKGAVVSMTLPMARDLASYGIRVMTIAPGLFRTPLLDGLPQKVRDELGASVPCPSRLGEPDEFGQLVTTILTNPMLNGEVIRLDGAIRMPP